jgi:hypothetical protein
MTKLPLVLCVTTAVTVAGVLMWKAEASPLTGTVDSLAVIKGYSTVQKAGCMFGTHRCPAGTKWVCAPYAGTGKKCVCRAC